MASTRDNKDSRVWLLGIDFEDLRTQFPGGLAYDDAVPGCLDQYLDLFARLHVRATFFVVGELAKRHPELVRKIVACGHEVGCHTYSHTPLDQQTPETFAEDLARTIDALRAAGASHVDGFRAPFFSLTESTRWAYDVLAAGGMTFSSSVLPARSPIYGWAGLSPKPSRQNGILEIPVTISPWWPHVPIGGGVYFRCLPSVYLRQALARASAPVVSYFHPFDIDTRQAFFKHPGIPDRFLFHLLMKANRGGLLRKFERLTKGHFTVLPFGEYVASGESLGADE